MLMLSEPDLLRTSIQTPVTLGSVTDDRTRRAGSNHEQGSSMKKELPDGNSLFMAVPNF